MSEKSIERKFKRKISQGKKKFTGNFQLWHYMLMIVKSFPLHMDNNSA